jgi:hypothetical protein
MTYPQAHTLGGRYAIVCLKLVATDPAQLRGPSELRAVPAFPSRSIAPKGGKKLICAILLTLTPKRNP